MFFYSFLFVLVALHVLNGFINLWRNFRFLIKEGQQETDSDTPVDKKKKIVILIPVLREQEIIKENIDLFSKLTGDFSLVYITTEKENYEKEQRRKKLIKDLPWVVNIKSEAEFLERMVGFLPKTKAEDLYNQKQHLDADNLSTLILKSFEELPSTAELIDKTVQASGKSNVYRVHYPRTQGYMAHQLNYACKNLPFTGDKDQTYILVYNADSQVSKGIVQRVARRVSSGQNVLMQSSLFLSNYQLFPRSLRGAILQNIALAQSRWTLMHEITRIRGQSGPLKGWFESGHLVGHGTCIRLDILERVGFFPEQFSNEDLPLGYFISLIGEKIYPMGRLENAESPTTIRNVGLMDFSGV